MPEPQHTISQPIALDERSSILDALRGFALIGVLTDNILAFSGWAFMRQHQQEALATWPADGIIGLLELAFIHGKFYSILSLLFGIGFAIQLARNRQRGVNGLNIFYRRLFILLLFWSGTFGYMGRGYFVFICTHWYGLTFISEM